MVATILEDELMEPVNITQQELLAQFGELTLINGKLRLYIENLEAENAHLLSQQEQSEEEKKQSKKSKN